MKCHNEACTAKTSIIGHCKYCGFDYCNTHRLPEVHLCPNLLDLKQAAHDANTATLMKYKTVEKKVADV